MKDFNNCKMYKLIVEGSDLIYIGHTCGELCNRLNKHKNTTECSSKILFDMGIVKIILIEKYPCSDMDEARRREQELLDEYKDICVNLYRAYNSEEYKKEYKKEYQEINKDKFKEYREKNKDKIKDRMKEWQINNKDKIKEWRINNKDKVNGYYRQWYENNKDKKNQYKKEYRLRKKEMKQMTENDIRL